MSAKKKIVISLTIVIITIVQESFKLNEVNHGQKCFFFIGGFPYLILGDTNNVLHFSVIKFFVYSVESGTSEKVLQ